MNHNGTEFQDHVKHIGKMVSGYTSTGFSIFPSFLFERHALGPKKWTWCAEELKIETNTILNSPSGIQFPKAKEEPSFLFRELWEDRKWNNTDYSILQN